MFNQENLLLKNYLGAFKCLGYILTSKGTKLKCPRDILENTELLIPKCPVLCLVWKASRQGSLL